jgi:iron complex transport system permease protein
MNGDQRRTVDKDAYLRNTKFRILFIAILVVILAISSFVVLRVDLKYISFMEMFQVLFGTADSVPDSTQILINNIYLPRLLSGIVGGMALGVAGAVMQCVLRNPLGSPYTLGVSNAAAFGASIAIVLSNIGLFAFSNISYSYLVSVFAFIFAMVATGIIILLVKMTKVDPSTMVLAGVAISSIFSAGISFLQYIFSSDALADIVFWQFGSLGKPTWVQIAMMYLLTVSISVYFFYKRWDYNALDNGDEVATSLGVNTSVTRIVALTLCSLLTALVVSFMGIIAFIGLIAPHMIRILIGNDHRFLIPGSMILGALVLTIADCVGQNLFSTVIPVGIVTSFLGGPLFLYLLIGSFRKKNKMRKKV